MLFNLGKFELIIVLAAFAFLVVGVPSLGYAAARLTTGAGRRIAQQARAVYSRLRGWRA